MKLTQEDLAQLESLPTIYYIIQRVKKEAFSKNESLYKWRITQERWSYLSPHEAQRYLELRRKQNHRLEFALIAYSIDLVLAKADNGLDIVSEQPKPSASKKRSKQASPPSEGVVGG